jgi:hypothetical protein
MSDPVLGPDGWRYWHLAGGGGVPMPFMLRWLLPVVCRQSVRRWSVVWWLSWPVAAVGMAWWCHGRGLPIEATGAAVALLLGLPGVLGPRVTRPVGVDLPALALGLIAAGAFGQGWWWVGLPMVLVAACARETSPVWVALWIWSPLPLVALVAPLLRRLIVRPVLDPLTDQHPVLRRVHEHPFRSAVEHRAGRGRDAWLWVAPWGATLAALWSPSWWLVAVLVAAHVQLVAATDTVRLLHTAAGPVMAVVAAETIPVGWLLPVVIAHWFWWSKVERV